MDATVKTIEIKVTKDEMLSLPAKFGQWAKKTGFDELDARLIFVRRETTRERTALWSGKYLWVFELRCDYQELIRIPGHRFVCYCEFDGGWLVYPYEGEAISKELYDSLDASRCDVCHTNRARKKLFVLRNMETGAYVFVGGACAKKFRGVNLYDFASVLGSAIELASEITEKFGFGWDLPVYDFAERLAMAVHLIRAEGYIPRSQECPPYTLSTATRLALLETEKNLSFGALSSEFKTSLDTIKREALSMLKAKFERDLASRWTEFGQNCVTSLERPDRCKTGMMAFFGKVYLDLINGNTSKKESKALTGYDKAPLNKMADLGEFEVLQIKWGNSDFGDYMGLTLRQDDKKLWIRIGGSSKAGQLWENEIADRDGNIPRGRTVMVTLRGKVTSIKPDIAFAKNVTIKGHRLV